MHSKHPRLLVLGLSGTAFALAGPASTQNSVAQSTAPAPTEASLVWGDVDGDGLDDVLAIDASGQTRLLMNFGDGRFEDITEVSGLHALGGASCALFVDLDGDERLDLYLGSSETRLWRNLGNATFEPLASGIEHDLVDLAVRAVDQDRDGRVDLQVHTEAGDLVYRNLGQGRFDRLELPLLSAPAHVGWVAPGEPASANELDPASALTPAERRLRRWIAGRTLGSASPSSNARTAGPIGPGGLGSQPLLPTCVAAVSDSAGGGCIGASSVPTLGKLYPLGPDFNIDAATGYVGMGTTSPQRPLHVRDATNGTIRIDRAAPNPAVEFNRYPDGDFGSAPLETWHVGATSSGFYVFDKKRDVERFTIDASGNAGLGTSAPGRHLDIDGSGVQAVRINSSNDHAALELYSDGTGLCSVYSPDGTDDLWFFVGGSNRLKIDDATGLVSVEQSLDVGGRVQLDESLNGTSDGGIQTRYQSGGLAALISGYPIPGGYQIALVNNAGTALSAGMYHETGTDTSGLYAGVKSFRVDNPDDDHETDLVYACVEGPEAAMYLRGTGQLLNGSATVVLPRHFEVMAVAEGMTVQVTPGSAASEGLAVLSKSPQSFEVRELRNGKGDYAFDWEVKAVRKGYEDFQVVRPKLRPRTVADGHTPAEPR